MDLSWKTEIFPINKIQQWVRRQPKVTADSYLIQEKVLLNYALIVIWK